MEEIQLFLDDAKESMDKTIAHLQFELSKIRAGRASANMFEGLSIEYYGSQTPISQVSSTTTPDARTLLIKPFERSILGLIERAIKDSNSGVNPMNDGELIRITIPALTEERRKDLVKQTRVEGETCRVGIRAVRKETNEELKKLQKEGASEDEIKDAEAKVQKLTDGFIAKVDEILSKKEAEILTV